MKIRNGYISNSSSSSFVLIAKREKSNTVKAFEKYRSEEYKKLKEYSEDEYDLEDNISDAVQDPKSKIQIIYDEGGVFVGRVLGEFDDCEGANTEMSFLELEKIKNELEDAGVNNLKLYVVQLAR